MNGARSAARMVGVLAVIFGPRLLIPELSAGHQATIQVLTLVAFAIWAWGDDR